MKENMYTYHYFQNRAIKQPFRIANLIFHMVLLASTMYIAATLYLAK